MSKYVYTYIVYKFVCLHMYKTKIIKIIYEFVISKGMGVHMERVWRSVETVKNNVNTVVMDDNLKY